MLPPRFRCRRPHYALCVTRRPSKNTRPFTTTAPTESAAASENATNSRSRNSCAARCVAKLCAADSTTRSQAVPRLCLQQAPQGCRGVLAAVPSRRYGGRGGPRAHVPHRRARTSSGDGRELVCHRSRPRVSNPEPAVYKTAALPIELGRPGEINATYSSAFFFARGRVTRFFGAGFSTGTAASTESVSLLSASP